MSDRRRTQGNLKSYVTRQSRARQEETTTDAMTAPASASSVSPSLPPDLENLRQILTASMRNIAENVIEKALSSLTKTIGDVKTTVDDHSQRLADLEEGLTEYTDRVTVLERHCEQLATQNAALKEQMTNDQNRSRRFNVRVTSLPEKSEGEDVIKFMSNFFYDVLGPEVYQAPPTLDIAHRIGRERSGRAEKPRVMIVRFHYYQDKVRALKADRNHLVWRDQKVLFFPDYAPETVKLRASFKKIKSLLWSKKVSFRLTFPAVLKVQFKNKTRIFKNAADATQFYDKHIARYDAPAGDRPRNGAAEPEEEFDDAGLNGDGATSGPGGGVDSAGGGGGTAASLDGDNGSAAADGNGDGDSDRDEVVSLPALESDDNPPPPNEESLGDSHGTD